jgi:cytochrome c oxidase assembly protein subunit 15
MSVDALKNYVSLVIFYNVLVILWGAYVRATGSGAGCGSHWPLCNGQFIPVAPSVHTQIEFSHRISSGLSLPLVLFAGWCVFKKYSKGTWIRKPAAVACISILMEALIGAGLVLFSLVSHDQSLKRTISIALHFANTLVLLGSLVLTYRSAGRQGRGWGLENSPFRRQCYILVISFFMIGVAGSITALGDTLFPSLSLEHGIRQDWSSASHFLVKLRVFHPILAIFFVALSTPWIFARLQKVSFWQDSGKLLIALLSLNIGIGLWNLIWLVPIGLQILHLSMALMIWITLVTYVDHEFVAKV